MSGDWKAFYSRSEGIMMWPAEESVRFIARFKKHIRDIGLEPEKVRAVDVGCGNGRHLWAMHREGFRNLRAADKTAAVDTSPYGLVDGTDYEFFVHDIIEAPVPGEYELGICYGVIDHLERREDIEAAVSNVLAALAPGGWFGLSLCSGAPDRITETVATYDDLKIIRYTGGIEEGFPQGLFTLDFVDSCVARAGEDYALVYTEDRTHVERRAGIEDKWSRLFTAVERKS